MFSLKTRSVLFLTLGYSYKLSVEREGCPGSDGRGRISVVAAASHGAKLARTGGGFKTWSSAPVMTGQLQVF